MQPPPPVLLLTWLFTSIESLAPGLARGRSSWSRPGVFEPIRCPGDTDELDEVSVRCIKAFMVEFNDAFKVNPNVMAMLNLDTEAFLTQEPYAFAGQEQEA